RSSKTKRFTIQPPPLSGIYKVPGSGSLFAWKPEKNIRQAYHGLGQSAPAVPGRADITARYNGAQFAFSSPQNRDAFLSNPAKYAPQFDGHCAYGVAKGGKVPANPNLWRIVDGKLYLNITRNVAGFWTSDIPGNISLGNSSWNTLEPSPASSRPVPELMSKAPTGN
ncbi:MAG: YHS domain-containing protein, partial [Paracoccaceae bacterium]